MNLGVQLRVYRKSKNHSVQKVSELTGISADKIYKWEKGTRPSDAEDLLKIREYMSGKVETAPKKEQGKLESDPNNPPPAFVPIPWQEYIQLIHLSLEALRAGQSQILNQQARTIAEVRGYGQYQIQREVNWDQEKFVKIMERVGTIIGANLKVDDEQDNS